MTTIFLINGPNLNLLGVREPDIYGYTTLADIEQSCQNLGQSLGLTVQCYQSNHEGVLIDTIQAARTQAKGIIINPAAYSHTSIAILDALKAFNGPIIEVHLSDIHTRESFRHHSYVSLDYAPVFNN
jgi:3-dehydroquinate dehydratase II